ncbi:LOW QUALITY PROTEIN: ATPase, partial [Micromonospora sp. ATCC 39149]
ERPRAGEGTTAERTAAGEAGRGGADAGRRRPSGDQLADHVLPAQLPGCPGRQRAGGLGGQHRDHPDHRPGHAVDRAHRLPGGGHRRADRGGVGHRVRPGPVPPRRPAFLAERRGRLRGPGRRARGWCGPATAGCAGGFLYARAAERADGGHRAEPHRRRPGGQAADLDRPPGRRGGVDPARLHRRGDRADQPQAAGGDRAHRRRHRQRDLTRRVPDPEKGRTCPTSSWGRCPGADTCCQIETAFTARAASEIAARSAEAGARDAAAAAQASEARARRSEERMRQFVADASHELRTPLTTIRGFAELYRQGAARAPEETAGLLRRIEDEAARMGLLVEDLLLLARLDRERPLSLAPVELPLLAGDAVQAARVVAPDRRIELEIEPGSGPLVVLGDDARLRQVIGNLMTNALTHTPPDASVTLRLRTEPGNLAVVEVADTGPGLSPEQSERVFERFYRADAARTRRAGGMTSTGLGLAIVAALVAAHHGTVEVGETPGGGATFRVRVPLLPDPGGDPGE